MRHWVLVVGAVGLGVAPAARAQSPGDEIELTWQAPSDCPNREQIVAAVSRLVSTGNGAPDVLKADIRVEHQRAASYALRLKTVHNGISGERVFHGRSCQAVTDAAVVTLALMLNPDSQLAVESAPEAAALAAPAAPVARVQEAPRAGQVSARPKEEKIGTAWFATSSLGLHVGMLPKAGAEVSLGSGVTWGRVSAWLRVGYALTENVHLAGQPNFGARLWAGSAAALGCWALAEGSVRLGPCFGLDVTRVQGSGVGVSHSRTAVTAFSSPVLGMYMDLRLATHVGLRLTASGSMPLTRPDTHLDDIGTVQRPAPLVAKADAGMIWHWP